MQKLAYALLFSVLNAAILWVRIRAEGKALKEPSDSPAPPIQETEAFTESVTTHI